MLTIVDCHTRESLEIEARFGFKGGQVVEALSRLVGEWGAPKTIRCDNGPEFVSRILDPWDPWNKVEIDFSRPGKPTDNALIESFNNRSRQECLNANCSSPWPMPGRRSKLGEGTIMSTIPTARCRIRAPMSSSQPVEPYGLDKPEGYDYIALGGMVPLKTSAIYAAICAVRDVIPKKVKLHILGFAKANRLDEFAKSRITSFDTTSPLIRAFKDSKINYYVRGNTGKIEYYSAIRIPQALQNPKLLRLVKAGRCTQEALVDLETKVLARIRNYDRGNMNLEETLDAIMAYNQHLLWSEGKEEKGFKNKIQALESQYRRTLKDRPWNSCDCSICKELSVEVVIFRGSNRNKRRGIHNLAVFHDYLQSLTSGEFHAR